jgi:hypothetical protein
MPNIPATVHQTVVTDARVSAARITAFMASAKSAQSSQN